jgi:porin
MRRFEANKSVDMLPSATALLALVMAVSEAGEPAGNAAFPDRPAAGVTSASDAASATAARETIPTAVAGLERPLEVPPLSDGSNPFEGDFQTRQYILGDWGGARTGLAESGLSLDVLATQFYQGVASGGRQQAWDYGGKIDYLGNVDGEKAGLGQGFFVNMHAETRFGTAVNNIDGLLTPSNIAMMFPEPDGSITAITGLKLVQALSEDFALFIGKINTLDEYPLRYGMYNSNPMERPGLSGFMNTSLVFNPIVARTVPYSGAAAGGVILRDGAPVFSLTVFDPQERAATGLQDLFADGMTIVPDFIWRTSLFDRPGIVNLGGTYSSRKYRSFDPAAYLAIPPPLLLDSAYTPLETGSWCVYSNLYQSLWVDEADSARNWGVFGQFGLSDGNPNPILYTTNVGVAGHGMGERRLDSMGVGYFYVGLSEEYKQLAAPILPQQNESGVEFFYNYAISPSSRITTDLQIATPSTQRFDTVIIPGLRLQLLF